MRPGLIALLITLVACTGSTTDSGSEAGSAPPSSQQPPSTDEPRDDAAVPESDDPDIGKVPLPDTPLPTLQPYAATTPSGTSCPDGFAYLSGAQNVSLGETDVERARNCACDPLLLREATFSSIPPYCMDQHPFPGNGQPWPREPLFASTRYSLVEDLRHLLPRWGRRLCSYSENLLATAGADNQRFVGSDEWVAGRCEGDHHTPSKPVGSYPTCTNSDGVIDLNVRSEWVVLDDVGAGVLANQAYPRLRGGMLALSTANTGQGGNSAAANNYGFHFHVYPWGFFDVGDPPGEGYIDDGVRFCATPGAQVSDTAEAEFASLRDGYVSTEDWSALWGAQADHPLSTEPLWTEVAAGRNHSCGLRSSTAVCWGSDFWGESSAPTIPLTSITVGWRHSCGLRSDGTAICWGDDASGQSSPPTETFQSLGAGDFFTCGLTTDGRALCWGNTSRDTWELPPTDRRFQHLAVGDRNACGVDDGAVHCWGETRWAQGQPPAEYAFDELELGYEEACGRIVETGTVACWGNLDRIRASIPGRIGQEAVSSGSRIRCTLHSDGVAECLDDLSRPGLIPPPDARFIAISVGYAHVCGVTPDGYVRCFGGDSFGQASPP